MSSKLFGALSLCRKAGKLVMGADAAEEAARSRKAALLLASSDLSARSLRRMEQVGRESGVPLLTLSSSMEELAPYAGKEYGIFAVCDKGFAKMIGDAAIRAANLDIEQNPV